MWKWHCSKVGAVSASLCTLLNIIHTNICISRVKQPGDGDIHLVLAMILLATSSYPRLQMQNTFQRNFKPYYLQSSGVILEIG